MLIIRINMFYKYIEYLFNKIRMKRESACSGFRKAYLYFSAWEDAVMQFSNCLKAILDVVKLDQGHLLVTWLLQYVNWLQFPVLAEDIIKSIFMANFFPKWRDMKCIGRWVDSDWFLFSKSMFDESYLSELWS